MHHERPFHNNFGKKPPMFTIEGDRLQLQLRWLTTILQVKGSCGFWNTCGHIFTS